MREKTTDPYEGWVGRTMSHLTDVMAEALREPPPEVPGVMERLLIYHRYRVRIRVNCHIVPDDHWDKVGSIKKRVRWGIYDFVCRWLKM